MKNLIFLCALLICSACSTNQKVLDKSKADLKGYLETPSIHRSQHLPDNINKFGLSYKQFKNKSNNTKESHSKVEPSFYIARDISENLQYFFPLGLSYKIKDTKKFKTKIFGSFSFGYSTETKGYFLPAFGSRSIFILSKKQAIDANIFVNSFHNRFYRHQEESTLEVVFAPSFEIGYLYQLTNKTKLRLSIALEDQYYSSDCNSCFHENNIGQITKIDKYSRSWVSPISIGIQSLILEETSASAIISYSKLGYKDDYQGLSYGINFSWFFATDG